MLKEKAENDLKMYLKFNRDRHTWFLISSTELLTLVLNTCFKKIPPF